MLYPSFVAWSLRSDPESMVFWENWLTENSDCRPQVQQARLLTIALHTQYQQPLSATTIRENVTELMQQVETMPLRTHSFRHWLRQHWAVAASLTGLILLAAGYWLYPQPATTLTASEWVKKTGLQQAIEKTNTASGLSTVVLSDGSTVTLEPGSHLYYPPRFEGSRRRVYLQGEAFFEVTKNPERPFLVYTGASVVRVVGTSFRVKASGLAPDQIAVRTGRVLVYAYHDFEKAGSNERALAEKALVLLPNEQVILDEHAPMHKVAVQHAADVAAIIAPQELVYDDRAVTEVLEHMATLYGVEIVYNQKAMSRCKITASFREESLEERLRNICDAIGTEFNMEDGKIVITGQPCR